jgi:hypothetical protein
MAPSSESLEKVSIEYREYVEAASRKGRKDAPKPTTVKIHIGRTSDEHKDVFLLVTRKMKLRATSDTPTRRSRDAIWTLSAFLVEEFEDARRTVKKGNVDLDIDLAFQVEKRMLHYSWRTTECSTYCKVIWSLVAAKQVLLHRILDDGSMEPAPQRIYDKMKEVFPEDDLRPVWSIEEDESLEYKYYDSSRIFRLSKDAPAPG